MNKEFKLKSAESPLGNFTGIDYTEFTIEFDEKIEDLKAGDLITPDLRDGQILLVVSVNGKFVVCKLTNAGKADFLNQKHAQKDTLYYKLSLDYVKEY